jgi:hypothetical protein
LTSAAGAALGGWILDNTAISISQLLQLMSVASLLFFILWIATGYLHPEVLSKEIKETELEVAE